MYIVSKYNRFFLALIIACYVSTPQKTHALSNNESYALVAGSIIICAGAYLLWPQSYESCLNNSNDFCDQLECNYSMALHNPTEWNIRRAVAAQEPRYFLIFFSESIKFPFLYYEKILSENIYTLDRKYKMAKCYKNKLLCSRESYHQSLAGNFIRLVQRQENLLCLLKELKTNLKAMDRFYTEQRDERTATHEATMESIALAKLNLNKQKYADTNGW